MRKYETLFTRMMRVMEVSRTLLCCLGLMKISTKRTSTIGKRKRERQRGRKRM